MTRLQRNVERQPHPWAERVKTGLVWAAGVSVLVALLIVAGSLAARAS